MNLNKTGPGFSKDFVKVKTVLANEVIIAGPIGPARYSLLALGRASNYNLIGYDCRNLAKIFRKSTHLGTKVVTNIGVMYIKHLYSSQ